MAAALALSLTSSGLALAASTTPMTGMVDMAHPSTAAASTAAPAVAVGALTSGGTGGVVGEVVREVSPVASVMPPMSSKCDGACVTDVSEMCTVESGLTVTTLLALFLGSRRDTFMGLLARTRPPGLLRRPRRHTPWTVGAAPAERCPGGVIGGSSSVPVLHADGQQSCWQRTDRCRFLASGRAISYLSGQAVLGWTPSRPNLGSSFRPSPLSRCVRSTGWRSRGSARISTRRGELPRMNLERA